MTKKELLSKCFSTKKVSWFTVVILCALMALFLIPILARNVPNVILLGLMSLFILSVMPRIVFLSKSEKITLLVLGLYMVVITAYKLLGKSSAALYYYFNTVQFFFFLGAGMLIHTSLSKKQAMVMLSVIFGATLLTMVSNVILVIEYGAMEAVDLFKEARYETNSINTPYVSAVMLLAGATLICTQVKSMRMKIASLLVSLLCFLFIALVGQRMIVLALTVLMYVLILLCGGYATWGKKLSRKTKICLLLGVIATVVLACVFCIPILRFIRSFVHSTRIEKRINQIIRFLKTGDIQKAGGSVTGRFNLIAVSVKTFVASVGNFLVGVGDHRVNNQLIGNHSFVADELARYGIVFASVSFALVGRAFKAVRSMAFVKKGTALSSQLNVLLLIVVLRATVGAIFDVSIGIYLFIVVPLLLRSLTEDKLA